MTGDVTNDIKQEHTSDVCVFATVCTCAFSLKLLITRNTCSITQYSFNIQAGKRRLPQTLAVYVYFEG